MAEDDVKTYKETIVEQKKDLEKLDKAISRQDELIDNAVKEFKKLIVEGAEKNKALISLQEETISSLRDVLKTQQETYNRADFINRQTKVKLIQSERAINQRTTVIKSKNEELEELRKTQKNHIAAHDADLKRYDKIIEEKIQQIAILEKEKMSIVGQLDFANAKVSLAYNDVISFRTEINKIRSVYEKLNENLEAEMRIKRENDEKQQAQIDSINESIRTIEENTKKLMQQLQVVGEVIENSVDVNEPPQITLKDNLITLKRGFYEEQKFIPKFDNPHIFGFSGSEDPSKLLEKQKKVTARKTVDLNYGSHLIFVYSDIVAEHFVGQQSVRVLRVVPLKRNKNHDIVHERFMKPLYFPVRTNRIEEINFILADEAGNLVKFASGRVQIGLHLKRVI